MNLTVDKCSIDIQLNSDQLSIFFTFAPPNKLIV
jgi:hypothetical protein